VGPGFSWFLPFPANRASQPIRPASQPINRGRVPAIQSRVQGIRARIPAIQSTDRAVRVRVRALSKHPSVLAAGSDARAGRGSVRPIQASERPKQTWTDLERRSGSCPGWAPGFAANAPCTPAETRRGPRPPSIPGTPSSQGSRPGMKPKKPPLYYPITFYRFRTWIIPEPGRWGREDVRSARSGAPVADVGP
jgi:hypothetical protein